MKKGKQVVEMTSLGESSVNNFAFFLWVKPQ